MSRATAIATPVAAAVALALSASSFAAPSGDDDTGRILVQTRAGLSEAQLDKVLKGHGARRMGRIGSLDLHLAQVPPQAQAAVLAALSRNPHVEFAEPDQLVELEGYVSNDPKLSSAWHLPKITADQAWLSTMGEGQTIAVLDTGVDVTHPDLSARMVSGWNAVDGGSDYSDLNGHGTKVSGSAAATLDNGVGIASVSGRSSIMPIRVSNRSDGAAYFSDIARGVTWAADNGADVANVSYNNVTGSSSIASAAQYMMGKGGIVVVAAGNDGINPGFSDSPYMITVSATNSSDSRTSWSSYGYYVDVAAPGESIYTTTKGGGYGYVNGTSFSSPVTAGVVALIRAANPNLSVTEVEAILESTADDLGAGGWDIYYGYGRINAGAAVAAALSVEALDSEAPVVGIASPTGGTVAGLMPVDVTASDNVAVARVDLYVNGQLLASDTAEPFAFSWDTTTHAEGSATLVAYGYDAAGNQGISKAVSVTVDNVQDPVDSTPPDVAVLSPGEGQAVDGSVKIKLRASDNVAVEQLACYVNGEMLGVVSGGDLTCNWNTRKLPSGTYTVEGRAVDAAGNQAASSVSVTLGGSSGGGGGDGTQKGNPNKGPKK